MNDPRPRGNFFVIRDFSEFERRSFEFSFVCPINIVEHRHEDDSIFKLFWTCLTSVQIFLDLERICNDVNPGKIFHSNSIGSK